MQNVSRLRDLLTSIRFVSLFDEVELRPHTRQRKALRLRRIPLRHPMP